MTRLAPGREQEIRARVGLRRRWPTVPGDDLRALLAELDAPRADLAAAVKVAEAARAVVVERVDAGLSMRLPDNDWTRGRLAQLAAALAACPVPTSERSA